MAFTFDIAASKSIAVLTTPTNGAATIPTRLIVIATAENDVLRLLLALSSSICRFAIACISFWFLAIAACFVPNAV